MLQSRAELDQRINEILDDTQRELDVQCQHESIGGRFAELIRLVQAGDVAGLRELFHAFFASIPHDWYRKNDIADYEGYYASIFYSHFAALGLDIVVEDTTNKGRIDMTVLAFGAIWLFEFKVVELVPQGTAAAEGPCLR